MVEGIVEISVLLQAAKKIREIYHSEDLPRHGETWEFIESCQEDGCSLRELGAEAFGKASYKSGSTGVLAVFETWELSIPRLQQSPRVALVIDEVEKPGNPENRTLPGIHPGGIQVFALGSDGHTDEPLVFPQGKTRGFTRLTTQCLVGEVWDLGSVGGIDRL